jgi:hypothetical protein
MEGKTLHPECLEAFKVSLAPTCAQCGKPILPGTSFYELEGGSKKVHPGECFTAAQKEVARVAAGKPPGSGSKIYPT